MTEPTPIIVYVCDTETVGKDAGPDRVVELAMVPVHVPDPDKAGEARIDRDGYYETFVRPGEPISFGAMATHNITEDMVASAPNLDVALTASPLGGLAKPPVLSAHNAPFDAAFLEDAMSVMPWCVSDVSTPYWLDTYRAARHVLPGLEGYSNQSLRYELGLNHPDLKPGGAHRALGDALVTALLLQRLLAVRSLRELCSVQHDPILLEKFTFGKHRNELFSDVPADYLQWIVRKSDLGADEKFSANAELRRRVAARPIQVTSGVENIQATAAVS